MLCYAALRRMLCCALMHVRRTLRCGERPALSAALDSRHPAAWAWQQYGSERGAKPQASSLCILLLHFRGWLRTKRDLDGPINLLAVLQTAQASCWRAGQPGGLGGCTGRALARLLRMHLACAPLPASTTGGGRAGCVAPQLPSPPSPHSLTRPLLGPHIQPGSALHPMPPGTLHSDQATLVNSPSAQSPAAGDCLGHVVPALARHPALRPDWQQRPPHQLHQGRAALHRAGQ